MTSFPRSATPRRSSCAKSGDRLWTKVWLMGAWEGDLRNPGDYITTKIGKETIVITKDENHQYNAFYNVCSHRGNQVAYGQVATPRPSAVPTTCGSTTCAAS